MYRPGNTRSDASRPEGLMVFTGNANPKLAGDVATRLGIQLGKATVGRFSDGEVMVEILENVRGKDVFVLQPTCAPTNDNLMELHADQIQGFFDIPVDNIYAAPILLGDVSKQHYPNVIVVSPDVGGVVRARAMAKRLDCDLAIIDKRRPKANVSEVMNIIGEVSGRTCIIMDDVVDTAGTLVRAADALKQHGAARVLAYCTHAVLSGEAVHRVTNSTLDELVVTDSIPPSAQARACPKIRVLGCAELLAETILRIARADSVSLLFMD
ncbi:MAG TPA: ribose-phosphate pyrophosphokinase [Burkholderiaceae bacterium]|nr:ribose-phosphate pyrophosphokinase [Burkholderiaceae bacterium]